MDKSKIQKVNKALIATVFASSGIAAVVSPPKAAAATSPFTDINQYSDNYNEILKLYSQGVMSGFADNTFRPDVSVTRGEAAKMLATALKLDTKNIQDPYYKDVPKGNQYYKYVAALQNAGIMSGYSNGMFMPNEVLTRGELAKMVVVGFHLEVSPTYNNIFKDVNSKTNNAIYIQTLIDLNITKGTTPVTFSPFDPVTRGQFASFVVGSQEKKNNETSYKITNVDDDAVYINGQSYTIPESLAHIFNEYNAPVLKGAFIEGDLSSKGIRSISKLTLNASGTSTRSLDFDGNYGSFGATIVVNGNYIEFSNMTLTGTMFVNETVRPPLHLGATYNQPLALGRVASNNISFINWSNPDNNKGDDSSNNNSNDLQNWTKPNTENDKPFVNWSKEKEEMKNVEKYLEFYNSSVARLVVSQTGTKIETNTKLPRVDIIGNVREFEIQGDIGTLNLNTETKLTIYGSGNIDWINYNSYTDLELYIDGRIGTLFVDNSYGKIDIGDYTYIDKVILPKDGSPNSIFDDFLDDKDNIGNITDPDGKPIDKEENENQNPDDKTKPIISITNVKVLNGSEIQADFTSDEVGTYYYIVREKGAEAPNKSEMVNRLSNKNVAHGTAAAIKGTNSIKVSNLGEKKEYVIYIMVVDGSKNASDIVSQEFQMKDGTPPKVEGLKVTALHGGTRAEFTFRATEPGDYYYYVRKYTTAPDPTTTDIVANPTGKGKAKAGELGIKDILTGLDAEIEYQLYVVMKDESGNFSEKPVVEKFTTLALDNIPPYVVGGELVLLDAVKNEFYLTVSEDLDSISAEKIENYDLSGTGIVNQGVQQPIHPTKVVYNKAQKRLIFTIPSLTGFVNGDNLVVTISPNVKDLADIEFENINNIPPNSNPPRNTAEYLHKDSKLPILTIKGEPEINAAKDLTLLTFNATKAGTYHYLIMESGLSLTSEDRFRFIEAVQSNASNFQVGSEMVDIVGRGGDKPAQLGDQKVPIPLPNKYPPLSSFKSYSIYMVLRDRSGNISDIQTKQVINDKLAPKIENTSIKIAEGDKKATFKFMSDEEGTYYYILRKAGETTVPVPTSAEEVIERGRASTMRKDTNEISLTIDPHQDYELYVAVQDRYKNASMLQVGTNSTIYTHNENQSKPISLTPGENGTGVMAYKFFSDGTPPKVEDPIVKQLDGKTFEVTFSEAVDLTGSDFKLVDPETDNAISPTYTWEWEDTSAKKEWEPRKFIIKFANEVTQSFDITVNATATDKGGWTFSKLAAKYQYPKPNANNKIIEAYLTGTLGGSDVKTSPTMEVSVEINTELSWEQTYYYAVTNSASQVLTKEDIINSIETGKWTQGITQAGKKLLTTSPQQQNQSEASFRLSLKATGSNAIFMEGQRVYLLTVDKYGNVVMDENGSLQYTLIKR
ncbi:MULTISPECIES: S-layer homology domain-containing protein [Lysinibacillus]|uniref:S-layer homology domain-containing protein n=1 Tax=Lysinibacillus TaxID=400634 RepID=UPI001C8B4E90|nr:S-layer homology domain-containing protein [Lysinibacillus sp. K60]MBX8945030.1 S-layer homology domain-containing protein [Lysinibacillus sp. K60]